ncbi:hypothetical protein Gohar_021152, partial [Gossypium harknessii]|nr:hypothetical protein [Gossypium harknessii]
MLSNKKILWEEMIEIRKQLTNYWIMGGDFNAIRNKSERCNCVGLLKGSKVFGSFIDKCKLVDLPLLGKKFTWYGPDKKKSRLDRFVVDEEWKWNRGYRNVLEKIINEIEERIKFLDGESDNRELTELEMEEM